MICEKIIARRSVGRLEYPAPSDEELELAVRCAMSAPDHKGLKPWQFVALTDNARVEFGRALLSAAIDENGALDEDVCARILAMPLRAPMVVMVATNYQIHAKVPTFEQLLSAGAAVQNMLLAFDDMGYSAMWRTGDLANHVLVKQFFGIENKDTICAFIYVGRTQVQMPERTFNVSDFLRVER